MEYWVSELGGGGIIHFVHPGDIKNMTRFIHYVYFDKTEADQRCPRKHSAQDVINPTKR